jgi:hypothetical protein
LIIRNLLNFLMKEIKFGSLWRITFEAASKGTINLDYKRRTAASYIELQSKFDKVNLLLVVEPIIILQIQLN